MNGWCGKLLRVNLSKSICTEETLNLPIARDYLGGRGLATRYFYNEVAPTVDPLSSENKLLFATGPLTGTGAPTGGRYMVVARSPLTGTIGCANSGGHFGSELKYAGYDMIIFEGKSPAPVYLLINNSDVQLKPAGHLWGKTTHETDDIIKSELNDKWKALETYVAAIGPAGENLVKIASIINDKHRAAARNGLGAVMGSKNLKAIAVNGNLGVTVADGLAFKQATNKVLANVKKEPGSSQFLPRFGTLNTQLPMNKMEVIAAYNFRAGSFEGVAKTNSRQVRENHVVRDGACFACSIGCAKTARVKTPEEFSGRGGGPEYESCTLLGPNCGVDNLPAILKANFLCNEMGMDTMSTGGTIACAMELFEKGFLTEEEVGYKLNFGNATALVESIKKMALRQDFGTILAEGGYRLAEKYGHPELFMGIKKQEMPGYHLQGVQGTGLEFATSNHGASHNRAGVYNSELWGYPEKTDPQSIEGKPKLCVFLQHYMTVLDALGLCQFICFSTLPEDILPLLNAAVGYPYTLESMLRVGERIWNLERLFNNQAGFTARDDTIPRRFLEEPMLKGAAKGQVSRLYEMLPEYYRLRGWGENGIPSGEKLAELGLR